MNLTLSKKQSIVTTPTRRDRSARKFVWIASVVALLLVVSHLRDPAFVQVVKNSVAGIPMMLQIHFLTEWLTSPWFYASLLLALLAERFLPAEIGTDQNRDVYKFGFDFLWIPPKFLFFATLWPLYMALVQWMVEKHLGFLVVQSVDGIPWIVRMIGGLLLVDFLDWCTHIARHKVRVFWLFHSIHHSQTRLNFFTEYRSHVFDDLLKWTIEAIPLILLHHTIIDVLTINRLRYWHTTIYHSNIRSNYGLLKYILVTPQSHRIHHSVETRHFDKNFGLTFSIWDHLFGTQCRNYDEYPATGIPADDSPVEPESYSPDSFSTFLSQFFYPFFVRRARAKED